MEAILILLIIIVPLIAQAKVNSNYNKYSKINNCLNITGEEVAKRILEQNGISNVKVNMISGTLTDHYDPRSKILNLSSNIYSGRSIASVAVAAHEVGHAIQDKEAYNFLRFRSSMVPVVNFSSRFATIFVFLGFLVNSSFLYIGIALLLIGLAFQLVTLPVEFDASNRAREQLQRCGLLSSKDIEGTKKVLDAAALTYVASFLATALQILRLILANRRR